MIILTRLQGEAPPLSGKGIRLAIYQGQGLNGLEKAVNYNLDLLEKAAEAANKQKAQLISFPELFLTGYSMNKETSYALSEDINGPSLQRVAAAAKKYDIAVICPYPEKAMVNGKIRYYDSAAMFDKNGILLKNYRKTHLWGPDEKNIWSFGYTFPEEGEPYTVHNINGFPVGLLICYEAEFPELFRILALKGAKLVVIPTAQDEWCVLADGTKSIMPYPDVLEKILCTQAIQNIIFVAYSNHYGTETCPDTGMALTKFLDNSLIADPHGRIMLAAPRAETLLICDCITDDYDCFEHTDHIKDRRPSLYKAVYE